ncbi:MAG: 16S rRNA (guanine(966)-N(2))-methyltransferase RsmD [Austwickia sp.]|jgi:16S rRNA (guanine966-N2)-methyltransferase|nr:MAG: 16S rRNA (guanine(966)-N(2))-methyltransferase RsmD [Austwickia sp.]
MTRIVAGAAGGLRLATPPGAGTRPTSERVREALFARLDHLGVLPGARVLDLYAGSGALGLEAGSRGAAQVLLVERSRPVVAVARRNAAQVSAAVEAAGGRLAVGVRADPVARLLAGPPPDGPFDVALLDPPYDLGEPLLAQDLARLCSGGWLTGGAVVVVERSSRSAEPAWPAGLVPSDDRRYGETVLWFAEASMNGSGSS